MPNTPRPNPDALLREAQRAEERRGRGRLKVFLGAAAGVGKTYAMLAEAHEQKARGIDVVAGYVETHGRKETDALREGLEMLPLKEVEHKEMLLKEFDLDAALARRPGVLLVDELAHSNAPGSRHPKRWQDVEELLRAGISVHTTVNVQHLESLNDVVTQITGVQVRETIPDSILEKADEVELVDTPPEELLQRLHEGKVYLPERVETALKGFFRKGNLIALRELALRRTADRVDAEMQSYRTEHAVRGLWPTKERVLVCIGPNHLAQRVIRSARRIGEASHAELICVYVESPRQGGLSPAHMQMAQDALRLAESLGMETVNLAGVDIVAEVLDLARQRNATLIVVGKPIKPRWREVLFGSVVDDMVRRSGEIDVHVITGSHEGGAPSSPLLTGDGSWWGSYAMAIGGAVLATGACLLMDRRFDLSNLAMVYLLAVALIASRFGPRETALSAFLGVAAFTYFFVPPRYDFSIRDPQYLLMLVVMLAVGMTMSTLTVRLRRQAKASSERERRSTALYTLSKELSRSRSKREIAIAAAVNIARVFDSDAAALLPDSRGKLAVVGRSKTGFEAPENEMAVAQWAFEKGEPAGVGTDTLPGAEALYLPLQGTRGAVGVLAVRPRERERLLAPAQRHLLETFAVGLALALERTILAKESQSAKLQMESEKMRSTLISSVSHDLRAPLSAISSAAKTLLDTPNQPCMPQAQAILTQSLRLDRLMRNLMDTARLESGEVRPNLQWHNPEELVKAVLTRTQLMLEGREVHVHVPPAMPSACLDRSLVEQALSNLLENAAQHTPAGTPVEVRTSAESGLLRFEISDRGAGLPGEEEERVFEKFHRLGDDARTGGFGLGLAIVRSIANLHGGRAWAQARNGDGSSFFLELPLEGPTASAQVD